MGKTHITIEDLTARGIDVLLHTALYNDEPEIRPTNSGKKEYIIKKIRNGYVSLNNRNNNLSKEEAPLPYYSSNTRDVVQLCERHSVSWTLNYVSKSSAYLATVDNINYVYKTAAGALARAVIIYLLKRKFNESIAISYRVLDKNIEL